MNREGAALLKNKPNLKIDIVLLWSMISLTGIGLVRKYILLSGRASQDL